MTRACSRSSVYRHSALRLPDGLREELLALLDAPPSRTIFLPPPPKPAPWDTETRVGRWHASAWGDAPDWLRDAVGAAGVPSITVVPRGGRSFQQRDHIQIAHKLGESENAAAFWRHEFGHFMDYQGRFLALNLLRPGVQSDYWSARSDFTDAMRADQRALTRDGRPGSARDAGRQIERELSDLSGVADRRARLSALAGEAGVDLDGPDGEPWAPLSEDYAEWKRRKRPNAGILVFDDLLRGQLAYVVSGDVLLVGTNRPYGARHQFGFDGPDALGRHTNTPARPWLGISNANESAILDIVCDHLVDSIK